MALTSGERLGPYETVSPAGAGGMGEVYGARDTRLFTERIPVRCMVWGHIRIRHGDVGSRDEFRVFAKRERVATPPTEAGEPRADCP
jgi:hypothetical protein